MTFQSYSEGLSYLYSRNESSVKLGLNNTTRILALTGNPHIGHPYIHIAGTNGKGSVCHYLSHILRNTSFKKIGVFTSPHILSFRERISVNNQPIEIDWMLNWLGNARKHLEAVGGTYFETVTAMALAYFTHCKCDISILETGLGGRLDSTNVVTPKVAVITPVSLDHTEYLGNTVDKIWGEKIAIMKEYIPCVINETRPQLLDMVSKRANSKNCRLLNIRDFKPPEWRKSQPFSTLITGLYASYQFYGPMLQLDVQRENLFQSVLAAEFLIGQKLPLGPTPTELPAMACRQQKLTQSNLPECVLDSAHNEASIQQLRKSLPFLCEKKEPILLFSVMADKDVAAILAQVEKLGEKRFFIPIPNNPRALTWEVFKNKYPKKGPWQKMVLNQNSFDQLLSGVNPKSHCVVVLGSFYLLGHLIPFLTPRYKQLKYFTQFIDEIVV